MTDINLMHGDCLELMRTLPDGSVDSIVTDPPYGLSFMGKKWDYDVPSVDVWRECLRVLKPGGHVLAFSGSRTYHRLACAVEDAGFEIRDQIMWLYGSGFPKSLNVSKAIDKAAGAEREVLGERYTAKGNGGTGNDFLAASNRLANIVDITAPATDEDKQWEGWGTALKPAHEPIVMARKPLIGTVAANVLVHGTGAINVDGCRVELNGDYKSKPNGRPSITSLGDNYDPSMANKPDTVGRWPANIIHDGSDDVMAGFPVSGPSSAAPRNNGAYKSQSKGAENPHVTHGHTDNGGSAARFFYCAKASRKDRGEGNTHPTVKPQELMRYLCRMVTPPGGIVLDPFMGSGSTGKAALRDGFKFVGMEMDAGYFEIARNRINDA